MFDGKMLTDELHAIGWKDITVESMVDETGIYTRWVIYRDDKVVGEFKTGYSMEELTDLAIAAILDADIVDPAELVDEMLES